MWINPNLNKEDMPLTEEEIREKALAAATKIIDSYYKNFKKAGDGTDLQDYTRWVSEVAQDLEGYIRTGERISAFS